MQDGEILKPLAPSVGLKWYYTDLTVSKVAPAE